MISFNSSLVRLIDTNQVNLRSTSKPFQFQFGTIDSELNDAVSSEVYSFQFQFGTIDRVDADTIALNQTEFQFQFGTIDRR